MTCLSVVSGERSFEAFYIFGAKDSERRSWADGN